MRDVILTVFVMGLLPWILMRPYVGILVWSWLGYMNPHRLTYGFAHDFPFAQLVALVMFVSLIFSKEPKKIPINALTVLWMLFILWMGLSTFFAWYPDSAWEQYDKVLKIQLIILLTMMVMNSKERLNMLVWIIVISIGFYGTKGGLFTLTGGGERVWGPPGSFIEGNNELALAILMILPLANYLRMESGKKWVRLGLAGAMLLCLFSALGSYSRGAFLGVLSIAAFLWIKSPKRLAIGVGVLVAVPLFMSMMPQKWHDRMNTIQTYEDDGSAMGRIDAWNLAVDLASDNLFGGGFNVWSTEAYQKYGPEHTWNKATVAHSIYFGVLGEHGWIGLLLFLSICVLSWRTGSWVIKHCKDIEALKWASDLSRMVQVSFIAYGVSGAFLSLAYFDLPWHLMTIVVLLKVVVMKHLEGGTEENGTGQNKKKPLNGFGHDEFIVHKEFNPQHDERRW